MHNMVAMQVAECKRNLSSDKLDCWLVKSLDSVEVVVDVAAGHVLEEEVNSQFILENVLHVIDEGVVCLEKDLLLHLDVVHLILLKDHVFIQPLHRVLLSVFRVFDEEDFSERAFVNYFFNNEVFKLYLLICILIFRRDEQTSSFR